MADSTASGSNLNRLLRLLVLAALLLAARYVVPECVEEVQYRLTRGRQRAQYETAGTALQSLKLHELSLAYQLLSQRVGPSVVHVSTAGDVPMPVASRDGEESDESDFGERDSLITVPREQGSGVIVDSAGYVITNFHVVNNAEHVYVTLSDGRRLPAEIVGLDSLTDVAVLKIDSDEIVAADWGDSDDLQEGALVWALGSPFGLKRSITAGIVSATSLAGVAGSPYQDYVQTDAAVNPGSSGGPLVNVEGRVVGINTAIIGDSYRGISFAVPSNIARQVYQQIRADGRVDRGWLGVELLDVSRDLARKVGLSETQGALVRGVNYGDAHGERPASDAGIQPGDVILSWGGKQVDRKETLIRHVGQTPIGSQVEVEAIRDGQRIQFQVKVGRRRQSVL